ncbi:hypothetical protein RQP46_000024 [Phenoliferia psychrophenolica]
MPGLPAIGNGAIEPAAPVSGVQPSTPWWKEACIYQIYPASFKDSTGSGVGDLAGILDKLDYIHDLGVDCVWICPFFKSPQFDLGYDIEDYQDVHAPYGRLSDVDAIIAGCHDRGMKIIFDLVVNHSSHNHKWFVESRSSKTNPKRDWYMWKPATMIDGVRHPPNNWKTFFGGSVWEWDELTEEYYLHYFCVEQPDMNWENPVTRDAIYAEAASFWLQRGCDGFRIDTVNMYSKHLDFPDAPVVDPNSPWQPAGHFCSNGPRIHEFIHEMNVRAFKEYGAVGIGELPDTPDYRDVLKYVSAKVEELDMVIQFDLAALDHGGAINLQYQNWKLTAFKDATENAQQLTDPKHDGWAVTCLENHDLARCVSRFGSDAPEHRVASAKMLATYLLMLSGTPIIYQGQELGLVNIPTSWPMEEYKDCASIGALEEFANAAKTDPSMIEKGIYGLQRLARDHARTPMQWTADSPHGGFSTAAPGETWMRVNDSFATINAAQQEKDSTSSLAFYRTLLKLRKAEPELVIRGLFELVDRENEATFVFAKHAGAKSMVIALNFTSQEQAFQVPKALDGKVALGVSSLGEGGVVPGMLRAFEAQVYLPL